MKSVRIILMAACALFLAVSAAGTAQESDNTLVYGEYGAPTRLVPVLANDAISIRLIELMYGSLIYYGSDGEIRGDLAESWEVSRDLKQVTFDLRGDVRWHPQPGSMTGPPFNADDVVRTFRIMMHPRTVTSLQARYNFIDTVEKVDNETVVFELKKPVLNVLARFNFKIIPAHLLQGVEYLRGDEELGLYQHPIGTGPYRFVSQRGASAEIVLEAYDAYHLGKPVIQRVVMRPFADQNIITQTLLYGGIDMEIRVPPRDIGEVQGDSRFELYPYSTLSYSFFGYNLRNPVLAIREVRMAMGYAVNRQEMLDSFFEGKGQLVSGPFAPGSWAYNLDVENIGYSPGRANRLLDMAGFTDRNRRGVRMRGSYELKFRMVVPISKENETTKRVILAFQNYLRDVGIQLDIEWLEWKSWTEAVFVDHDFDIVYADWLFDDSFDISSLFHSREIGVGKNNFGAYRNPEVDALLDEASSTLDIEKKRTIYKQLHRILAEDAPYTYLWTLTNYAAYNRKVRRVEIHPTRFFTYVRDWYIQSGE
jgi:peptide/nickel transport system substrate-binding protein